MGLLGGYLKSYHYEFKNEFLDLLTTFACYVRDSDVAAMVLSKFLLKDFNSYMTHNIFKWQAIYGEDWCVKQIIQWIEQDSITEYGHKKEPSLFQNIDEIILSLINQNINSQIRILFIQHQIKAIIANDSRAYKERPSQEAITISKRVTLFKELLIGCISQQDYSSHCDLIDYALDNSKLYPEVALVDTIFDLKNIIPSDYLVESGYIKLKEMVQNSLDKELSQGLRSSDDWAIRTQLSCNCECCNIAKEFLQSSNEIERIWPLAADGRSHIARVFDELELPIDLSIIEGSRPYKLVMKKNVKLFNDAQKRFKKLSELHEKILNL